MKRFCGYILTMLGMIGIFIGMVSPLAGYPIIYSMGMVTMGVIAVPIGIWFMEYAG